MRNFGMSRPATVGGNQSPGSHHGAIRSADSFRLPAQSIISIDPALERFDFPDALRNVVAAVFVFLVASVTGLGIALSLFICFFVKT